jgi:integrative and conjugative element protein (TIGR02256 family)
MSMLIFNLPGDKQHLILTNSVLSLMRNFRQTTRLRAEAGGQLFAKITPKLIVVAVATGPHRRDFRRRFSFIPCKKRLNAEIQTYFSKKLHYVGDWHTHPQKRPKPSWIDLSSMRSCFSQSRHELEHFLIVIVGNATTPNGIWVGLINNAHTISLALSSYRN